VCVHIPSTLWVSHFLGCALGNERTKTHDVIHGTFATIVWDVGFHVGQEQLHVLPLNMFNSFRWWVDIVLTKNGICTLVEIVIVNPTWMNLLSQFYTTQGFVVSNVVETKEWSYHDKHPHRSIPPLSSWGICMSTQVNICVFTQLCQCHLEFERIKGPSSFCLGYFS